MDCFGFDFNHFNRLLFILTGDKIRATDKVLFFKMAIFKNVIMMIEQVLEAIGFYYARYANYLRKPE